MGGEIGCGVSCVGETVGDQVGYFDSSIGAVVGDSSVSVMVEGVGNKNVKPVVVDDGVMVVVV